MIPFFIFILIPFSVGSTDWCSLAKPKGFYEGIGIYHRFRDLGTGDYVMFNRAGHEWGVKFRSPTDLILTLIDNSEKSVNDQNLINKFGTFALYEKLLQKPGGRPRHCSVISMGENSYKIVCRDAQQNEITGFNSSGSSDFVIIKSHAKTTTKEKAECLLFNRQSTNKSEYFAFNPFTDGVQFDCNESKEEICEVPLFLKQMDDSLFTKIDGIVDYDLNKGSTGHLILFNIENQPKYCTTIQDQPLSEECKSADNMKTLFDECFQTTSEEPLLSHSTKESESKETKSSAFRLIIIMIIVIVVTIIGVIVILLVVYNRKTTPIKNEIKPEDNTSVKPIRST